MLNQSLELVFVILQMTIREVLHSLRNYLKGYYSDGEIQQLYINLIESLTGFKRVELISQESRALSTTEEAQYEFWLKLLMQKKPLQYVLATCWFMDLKLYVDERVLIPRPETEELADWMIRELKHLSSPSILDVGTGSGCLALSLKKHLSYSTVFACDVSLAALDVASKNAGELGLDIDFFHFDLLNFESICPFTGVDVIVSNPPYIPLADCSKLEAHVVNFEPHLALFAPTDDPLIFYKAIGNLALTQLNENGVLYLELHAPYAQETIELYKALGFGCFELRKDMQGLDRMLKVKKLQSSE